jgi:outer membrane protein assembly factor BamB
LDAQSGELRWSASGASEIADSFGNLRGAPVVIANEVIFSAAYGNGLSSISLEDGKLIWAMKLGQTMFEQWSGPISLGRSVFLGRHDGYMHKIDVKSQRREWSIFLGSSEFAGSVVSAEQNLPDFQARAAWSAGGSSPILATPALDSGRLYVGTYEGYLYCIGNLGENA